MSLFQPSQDILESVLVMQSLAANDRLPDTMVEAIVSPNATGKGTASVSAKYEDENKNDETDIDFEA